MSPTLDIVSGMPAMNENPGPSWKTELASATRTVPALLEQLDLQQHIGDIDLTPGFSLLATAAFINKITPGDINDPLLRQILPLRLECDRFVQQDGMTDPVGDLGAQVATGLLHKYHGRALIISTAACAIHCRYCFRRQFPYAGSSHSNRSIDDTLHYLDRHPEIEEVILSGGDPLTLDDEKLDTLISKLEQLAHLNTLRIHTRLPVILPSRITDELVGRLGASRFHVVMVIHANHANELQHEEQKKLQMLHQADITLLNQSVLLRGINDNEEALIALSRRLLACHTLPYYLHLLDPVKGALHFAVDKQQALSLQQQLNNQLPGYLVPRLVQEIAGKASKSAIFNI